MSRLHAVGAAAALAVLSAACTDHPLGPVAVPPVAETTLAVIDCSVNVAAETLACVPRPPSAGGANANVFIVGGQDLFVRLSSAGTSYDNGTEILSSNVTLENLLGAAIGTQDGSTVEGVKVFFFSEPAVTSGSGAVAVIPDGTEFFTAPNQSYYLYNQIISPFELSDSRSWSFDVDPSVGTFVFTVYVAAPMSGAAVTKPVTWDGSESSDWATAGNWSTNAVPGAANPVHIPSDSLLAGVMPVLTADATAGGLRVGFLSTLGLGGFQLAVGGNVDATGTVSNGTLLMSGTGSQLNGTVDDLLVSGSTFLQGATRTTGAVSVTGSLTLNGNALSIQVP